MYVVSRVSIWPSALQPIDTVVNIVNAINTSNNFFMTSPLKISSPFLAGNYIPAAWQGNGEFR
jgi:hypothetical protein